MTTPRCATCAGDVRTVEPCPDCDCVPADRAQGYAVTVWVERVESQEAADALGLARATAYRHWAFARGWLRCELGDGPPAE